MQSRELSQLSQLSQSSRSSGFRLPVPNTVPPLHPTHGTSFEKRSVEEILLQRRAAAAVALMRGTPRPSSPGANLPRATSAPGLQRRRLPSAGSRPTTSVRRLSPAPAPALAATYHALPSGADQARSHAAASIAASSALYFFTSRSSFASEKASPGACCS